MQSLKWTRKLVVGAFLLATIAGYGNVNPTLSLAGDVLFSGPYAKQNGMNLSLNGRSALGGGVLGAIFINEQFGLEVGALYLNRSYQQLNYTPAGATTGVTATFSDGLLHFPAMLRFYPLKIVSIGLGAFYSQVVSSVGIDYTDANGNAQHTSQSLNDLNLGDYDFGAILAVGVEVPITDTFAVFGDARITQSLTSSARANTDDWRFRDLQLLAGLKFTFGATN